MCDGMPLVIQEEREKSQEDTTRYLVCATKTTQVFNGTYTSVVWSKVCDDSEEVGRVIEEASYKGLETTVFGWNGKHTFELTNEQFEAIA